MNAAATQPPRVRSIRFTRSSFPLSSAHEIKPTLLPRRRRRRSPSSSRARNKTVRPTVRVVVSRPRARIRSVEAPHTRVRATSARFGSKSRSTRTVYTDTHTAHTSRFMTRQRGSTSTTSTTRAGRRAEDVRATTRGRARLNEQSEPTTMSTARVPLNDGENLAVGAFGGIVETVVQSAYRVSRVRVRRRRRMNEWMDGWMTDKDGMRLPFTNGRTTTRCERPERGRGDRSERLTKIYSRASSRRSLAFSSPLRSAADYV